MSGFALSGQNQLILKAITIEMANVRPGAGRLNRPPTQILQVSAALGDAGTSRQTHPDNKNEPLAGNALGLSEIRQNPGFYGTESGQRPYLAAIHPKH
jgi:hypothetical protein